MTVMSLLCLHLEFHYLYNEISSNHKMSFLVIEPSKIASICCAVAMKWQNKILKVDSNWFYIVVLFIATNMILLSR